MPNENENYLNTTVNKREGKQLQKPDTVRREKKIFFVFLIINDVSYHINQSSNMFFIFNLNCLTVIFVSPMHY